MSLWKNSGELIKKGYKSLYKGNDGGVEITLSSIISYIILPIAVITLSWIYRIEIGENLVSDILTILSIFLAITLGVIFIVPEKLSKRLENDNSSNESDVNARIRYKNFCKLFIQRLSFVLVLSVIIIIFSIITDFIKGYSIIVLSALILGLFTLSILSILKLIIDIYLFLISDLDNLNRR